MTYRKLDDGYAVMIEDKAGRLVGAGRVRKAGTKWQAVSRDNDPIYSNAPNRELAAKHVMARYKTEEDLKLALDRKEVFKKVKELQKLNAWKDELKVYDIRHIINRAARHSFERQPDPIELTAALIIAAETMDKIRYDYEQRIQEVRRIMSEDMTIKVEIDEDEA